MATTYSIAIIGAGNAGVSLAARLRRDGHQSVVLIDPHPTHRYRPMLNYTATGLAPRRVREKPMTAVVPDGVDLIRDHAVRVDAETRQVLLASGKEVGYGDLVICPGLTQDWASIRGLREGFTTGWAASAHVPEDVHQARRSMAAITRGTVVFAVPTEPSSCGGTVLKALLAACAGWQKRGVLADLDVHLVTPHDGLLGLEPADSRVAPYVREYGITVHERSVVLDVDEGAQSVTLGGWDTSVLTGVTLAYVTPPSRAPEFIADSGLAAPGTPGLVDVDSRTLRHVRHDHVWGLGDAATLDTRPSGGALRAQASVLADNLDADRRGGPLRHYDGYTIVPIAVSSTKALLAEHTRDGARASSVPFVDLTIPRRSTYLFDRYVQPLVYFHRLLRGHV